MKRTIEEKVADAMAVFTMAKEAHELTGQSDPFLVGCMLLAFAQCTVTVRMPAKEAFQC